ncbi:hypothetical protein RCH07_002450 [Arthrobacter sp. CG_A4]|nr:hypothetical protein [Arthrobacter sp. CG_A4]
MAAMGVPDAGTTLPPSHFHAHRPAPAESSGTPRIPFAETGSGTE